MSDPRANLTTFILNMVAHDATSHEQIDAVMTECNRWVDEMLDQHAVEQREACAEAARNAGTIFGVEDAILNAVEKSDES